MANGLIRRSLALGIVALSLTACDRAPLATAPDSRPVSLAPTRFVLGGTVESGSGTGVSGVEVTAISLESNEGLPDYAGRSTVTDEDGNFSIGGLARGSWRIILHKRGYTDREFDVTLTGDVMLRLSLIPAGATASAGTPVF